MLVGEKRLALAHLYLGSLYARLDQCSCYIFKSVVQYDVVSYVDASFLQMFLWETFRALSSKPVDFEPVKSQKVNVTGVEKEKTPHHKP